MRHKRKTEIVARECRNKTCPVWFIASDDLNQQRFCSKSCKKTEASRRHNKNRRKREQKSELVAMTFKGAEEMVLARLQANGWYTRDGDPEVVVRELKEAHVRLYTRGYVGEDGKLTDLGQQAAFVLGGPW